MILQRVLPLLLLGFLELGWSQEGCRFSGWSSTTKPECVPPTNEAYSLVGVVTGKPHYSNVCCNTTKGLAQGKAIGRACKTTKCVVDKAQHKEPCATLYRITVEGRTMRYKENMRDKCTDKEGARGVVAVCCPQNSVANVLLSLYGAEMNEFPHQARLFGLGTCGGTVYNAKYILTAAHCVINSTTGRLSQKLPSVLLGTNVGGISEGEHAYEVEKAIVHPQYSRLAGKHDFPSGQILYDVALVKLKRNIDFKANPNIKALQIAPPNFNPLKYGTHATVVGWGTTNELVTSQHLQKANLKLRTYEECFDDIFDDYSEHSKQLLCLGGIIGQSYSPTAGPGDSGGPAICRDMYGHAVLCGITSFIRGSEATCAQNHDEASCRPSMFVAVTYFHKWIEKHAGKQDPNTLYKVYHYGSKVMGGQYEHQVHIKSSDGTTCGGTLVSENTVVTAGHCVTNDKRKTRPDLQIVAGGHAVSKGSIYKPRQHKGIHMSPKFRRYTSMDKLNVKHLKTIRHSPYYDDIAVIRLDRKVPIAKDKLAKLPTHHQPKMGAAVELAFNLHFSGSSRSLMQRDFKVLGARDCQDRLDRLSLFNITSTFNTKEIFCGVEKYSGGGICDREDGGALMCKNDKGGEEFCGIQTFRMCRFSLPSAFLNVHAFSGFIKQAMQIKLK